MLEATCETRSAVELTPIYASDRITTRSFQKCNKMQRLTRIPCRIKTHLKMRFIILKCNWLKVL